MATTAQEYVMRKGDTLEQVARKFGHRDWKPVWGFKDNRALVAKRGKPDQLQAGDKVLIPPSEADLKAAAAYKEAHLAAQAMLAREETRIERQVKLLDDVIADDRSMTDQIVRELKGVRADMKGWADTVDAAAILVTLGVSIGKICRIGIKSAGAAGEELAKLNKDALKEVSGMVKDPLEGAIIKAAAEMKGSASQNLAFAGAAFDITDKVTSPSFWANAWVQVMRNDKTFDEAASGEIGDDITDKIKAVEAAGAKRIKRLQDQQRRLKSQLESCRSTAKQSEVALKRVA